MLQAEISPSDFAAGRRPRHRQSSDVPHGARGGVCEQRRLLSPRTCSACFRAIRTCRRRLLPPELSASVSPDVAIYQGVSVPSQPAFNSIWFLSGPPVAGSKPLRVTGWNLQHPVTRWVRTRDISVRNPAALKVEPGDTVLAYTEGDPPAPLILAREQDGRRILIVGFNPHDSNFPLESAFPLLMAGSVEWMTHSVDEVADSLSTGEIDLPGPATKIVAPSGKEVPFARKGAEVHLLASGNRNVPDRRARRRNEHCRKSSACCPRSVCS